LVIDTRMIATKCADANHCDINDRGLIQGLTPTVQAPKPELSLT